MARQRILITGATGFVGRRAARRLLDRGDAIRVVTRSAERARAIFRADGVEIVEADLVRDAPGASLIAGCHAVLHCAGHPGPARVSTFERLHVGATGALLNAARAAGAARFVHIASDAVVCSGEDLLDVDESHPSPERFIDPYSRTKAEGERLVLEADADRLSTISLRPALVWGAGDTTVLPILVRLARSPLGVPACGRLDQPTESTHAGNLADAVLAAIDSRASGPYFIADSYSLSWRAFYTGLLESVGAPARFFRIPVPLARAGAGALDDLAAALRLPVPLARFGVASALTARRYDTSGARRSLQWRVRVGFEEGLESLRAWSRSIGGARGVAAARPEPVGPAAGAR